MNLHYTQASAGSGKTHRVEQDVADKLEQEKLLPSEIIGVTFSRDAAAELKGRISKALLIRGKIQLANGVMSARIGTVHSVFGQLLTDFAFELGLSPKQRVLDDLDKKLALGEALDSSLTLVEISALSQLGHRLQIEDWRADILKIIQLMRENALLPSMSTQLAQESITSFEQHLPKPDRLVSEAVFIQELKNAVHEAKKIAEPTVGLSKATTECETILRQPAITWQNWVKVSKLKPTKMGADIFANAMTLGADVLKCPEFRLEIAEYINLVFRATEVAMTTFAEIKKIRGLVDFVDQEELALVALENTLVQERLKTEVRYLIIDEFQDSSPLQLALFSKMSELVEDVLMVGDAKQAIYGFRGSDPKLTLDVLNYVQKGGGAIDTLSHSWRSRPGLVDLTNELFTAPFSHLLDADQVQLTSKCSYTLATPELEWWTLEFEKPKSNMRIRSALAEGIREHIENGVEIWDKEKQFARNATWKDLAVLCRGNAEAAELAGYCARIGIPVSLERTGLVECPEVSLALACLRRLIDPSDSLASAEILALNTGATPEHWLKDRIDAVSTDKTRAWNDNAHPALTELTNARHHVGLLSTKETLDLAMLAGDVMGTVCQWTENAKLAEHRLANLAKLSQLVDEYESHCQTRFLATTPTGFLIWLKDQEQSFTDKQAANPGDAVTITTYHRSKGLEWPIVICSSLETPLKMSLFGPRTIDQGINFDWNDPLNGRSLCYWPNPFPAQKGKEVLTEQLRQSAEWSIAEHQARNEAIQLLYVGTTRARDQLILPTIGQEDNVGEWLSLLNSDVLPPSEGTVTLPSGSTLKANKKSWIMPDTPTSTHSPRNRHWLASQLHMTEQPKATYYQPASSEAAVASSVCEVVHDFNSRISLNGNPDMEVLGSALHHCLALVIAKPDINVDILNSILTAQIPAVLQAKQIIERALALVDWLKEKYPEAQLHTEMPITQILPDGGLRQGAIDLVVETESGWIVIDHKSNPQPKGKWTEIAKEYSGQLSAYSKALESLSKKSVLSTLVHFSVSGGLVEVKMAS